MRSLQGQATHLSDRDRTGRVFDIQRFSVHDGSGIRTTVFLKGCTLMCAWCQNPEGISPERTVVHLKSECIGCRTCVRLAQNGGAAPEAGGVLIDPAAPEDFDALMQACPADAIRWNGMDMRVGDVLKRVLRDRAFYAHGGGMTLSGGEPLLQPEFAAELLAAAGEEGLNTAVETALHVPFSALEAVLPYTDTLYADLKLMDEEAARTYIGTDGRRILRNLRRVLSGPYRDRIVVRTPLVPGITATEENIARIAGFLHAYRSDVRYELLNYNALAPAKYALVGRTFALGRLVPLTAGQLRHLAGVAGAAGLRHVSAEGAADADVD